MNWDGFFKNNIRYKALLCVDGEEFIDTTKSDDEAGAKRSFTSCWTLPEYNSDSFEIIKIWKDE